MALELPDYVVVAFNLIGLPWPGIDEDELRAWAGGVRRFADDVCDHSSQVNQTMRELADSSESSVVDAVAGEWERHHQLLTELHGPIYDFADALNVAADAVYAQKLVIIGAAAALAAEFTATQVGAIFTLGADEAAVPAEIISTRAIVKFALEELAGVIIGKLINFAAQEISDHLNRTISSMLNGALQVGMEVQSLKLTPKAVSDVSKKLTGQATEVEDTGSKANAENTSRGIEDQTGGSGWSEVINALKQMLFEIAGGLFRNLPGTISRVLGDIAEFLLRFAERVKAADDDGDVAVPSGGARTSAPGIGATPGSEPVPLGSGGKEPDLVHAGDNPAAPDSLSDRPPGGDPVDLATGDVMLAETDVTLPGVLPLVLERTHRSSMQAGRWFGRSWMSSLDQRLLLTDGRIIGAFADGRVLTWMAPGDASDSPLIPLTGPIWPLLRNVDGSYEVSDPQRGLTWRFEHRAGYETSDRGEGELPLISVTDRIGHEIVFNYDAAGRPLSVTHSGGYRVFVSLTDGHVIGLTLAGRDGEDDVPLRRFEYDTNGNLSGVINSSGLPMRFTYDDAGRLTSWTDRNNYYYRYTFDAEGRCIRGDGPDGVLSGMFTYEPGITRWTNIDGAVTTYEITDSARLAAIIDPLGNVTRWEYGSRGRVTTAIDPLSRITRYAYDDRDVLTVVTRPDGSQARTEYDDRCQPVLVTGPDGSTWRQEYDSRGNRTRLIFPDGRAMRYLYDDAGHLAEIIDPDGAVTLATCDAAGQLVTVTSSTGGQLRYDRDGHGRITRITDPNGNVTALDWTAEGFLASKTLPDSTVETFTWDAEDLLIRHVDSAGAETYFEYGPFDKPITMYEADGSRTEFRYDRQLRPVEVVNGSLAWRYEYDAAGQLTAEIDYNGATTKYHYDQAGQIVSRVNGAGQESVLGYDILGNLTERSADGATTTFGYDAANRLVHARNPDAEILIERDALGRVIAESCNGRVLRREYDAANRVTRRVTPSGTVTNWDYNQEGQPATMTAGGHRLRFGYDRAGQEVRRELPGGLTLTQDWDSRGRLNVQALTGPDRTGTGIPASPDAGRQLLQRRVYSYRADGYPDRVEDLLAGTRTLILDPLGRVTEVTGPDLTERYAYGQLGNLIFAGSSAPSGPPDAAPAIAEASGPREFHGTLARKAGNIRYRYDRAGRVITRQRVRVSHKPDTWHYQWDPDNRLTSVTTPDGDTWRYQYDPFGRRISKQRYSSDGRITEQVQFTWDDAVLAEQTMTGADEPEKVTTWDYLPGSFTPVTQASHAAAAEDADQDQIDQEFHAIIADLTGAPAELTTPDGILAGQQRHDLWGNRQRGSDGAQTPFRFPGQYADPETGLCYNYQRYYDPAIASYLTPDPLGLQPSPNPHSFVSNPYISADPLGLAEQVCYKSKAEAAQKRVQELKKKYGFGKPTLAVIGVKDSEGNIREIVTASNSRKNIMEKLKGSITGEEWLRGVNGRHAEQNAFTILDEGGKTIDGDVKFNPGDEIVYGATSVNICNDICKKIIEDHGLTVGGETYTTPKQNYSPYRTFWKE